MQVPLDVTFRNMERDDSLVDRIDNGVRKLEKFFDSIIGCHVVVEAPHQHHRKGGLFHVRIRLTVPRREITVGRDRHENHAHEDVQIAVRDAFNAARRQLQDYVQEMRGQTKVHEARPH